jgi:uncharacterized protein YijF (DUF1287 family)
MPGIDRRSLVLGLSAGLMGCGRSTAAQVVSARGKTAQLLAAARRQVGVTVQYDAAYSRLAFPNGDVPRERGVCCDVIVRAYRDALQLDLQALVNRDMRSAFAEYPHKWGLRHADANIDHRRVPNLQAWLARHHAQLPLPRDLAAWQPGDIFTSAPSMGAHIGTHIGFVSDRAGARGPMIIHNIGQGAREEDALGDWPLTGRYRWALG